MSVTVFKAN